MTDEEQGRDLDGAEATALAHIIVARHLQHAEDWLEWEDYPHLGQYAFERLTQEVRDVALQHSRIAKTWGLVGVDAGGLLEEVLP